MAEGRSRPDDLPERPSGKDPATILFTSGSTATPKCVVLCHRHHRLAGVVVTRMLGLRTDDSFLQFFPLFHMNGLGHLLGAATAGSQVLLEPRYRTSEFRSWIRERRPTVTSVNATHIKMLATDAAQLSRGESSLRVAQLGLSAVLADDLYSSFEREFGCVLLESYGLTESGTLCSVSSPEARRRRSCGRPVAEYEVRIVNDLGENVPVLTRGSVEIRLPSAYGPLPAYWGQDAPDPESWFDTGDVGYFDADGFLFWVDREKELIKRAGENIAPSEVEMVLEAHAEVAEAVVVGVSDDLREEVPWAWVRCDADSEVTAAELLEHCRERLAKFKVPERIEFVEEFPRTGVGKIDRKTVGAWSTGGAKS